ncbi:MAG: DUF1566 domain-containing protein [Deltaproteobacteria bacterium]|nr:DUF1566 domain-containing protein [Deltaproteobacteria bacterium]
MRRPTHRCLVVLPIALVACRCQEPGAPCDDTSDCLENEICVEQRCRRACNTDSDCEPGVESCLNGACVAKPGPADAAVADGGGDGAVPDAAQRDLGARDRPGVDRPAVDSASGSDTASRDQGGSLCGNLHVDNGEVCDDGLYVNSDDWALTRHCNANCDGWAPYCGDGVVDSPDEACDSGPANGDGWSFAGHCNGTCSDWALYCGDTAVETGVEDCDDGNLDPLDGCAWCTHPPAIPDTGQTTCYNETASFPCPASDQPFYGQDAQYGPNAMSFTDNGDNTIGDPITGLTWSKLHSSSLAHAAAASHCENLTTGSFTDWRLPEVEELRSIVDLGRSRPAADSVFGFSPYSGDSCWAGTPYPTDPTHHWTVEFNYGESSHDASASQRVLCVRGATWPVQHFRRDGETIVDTTHWLQWQRGDASGVSSWETALAYCAALTLEGISDWRLPNVKELWSIADPRRTLPAIDTSLFINTNPEFYWSSTTSVSSDDSAWAVHFSDGSLDRLDKNEGARVRCVCDARPESRWLPDTGQTRCYDTVQAWPCPEPGYPMTGQDAQHGSNLLRYLDHGDATITDRVTGLMWWNLGGTPRPHSNAQSQCSAATTGGHDDWRLPTVQELRLLIDYQRFAPAIDPLFSGGFGGIFWTSTALHGDPSSRWTVDLGSGASTAVNDQTSNKFVCVRHPIWQGSVFAVEGDALNDTTYRLLWQIAHQDVLLTWEQALAACEALSLDGHEDWRLPNIKEFGSLLDPAVDPPTITAELSITTYAEPYWSSTSDAQTPAQAWQLDFQNGALRSAHKVATTARARCVRDLP